MEWESRRFKVITMLPLTMPAENDGKRKHDVQKAIKWIMCRVVRLAQYENEAMERITIIFFACPMDMGIFAIERKSCIIT